MKVRARERGQYGRQWFKKGDTFECEPGKYCSWMEPLDNDGKVAAEALNQRKRNLEVEKQRQVVEREQAKLQALVARYARSQGKVVEDLEDQI